MATRIGFALLLTLVAGCGKGTGTVTGTVQFKGAGVPSGHVVFVSEDGRTTRGEIQDGYYEVKDVPAGEAVVVVIRLDPKASDPVKEHREKRKKIIGEGKEISDKELDELRKLEAPESADPKAHKRRHLLPYFYADPATSDLRFTVKSGSNSYDIQLLEK